MFRVVEVTFGYSVGYCCHYYIHVANPISAHESYILTPTTCDSPRIGRLILRDVRIAQYRYTKLLRVSHMLVPREVSTVNCKKIYLTLFPFWSPEYGFNVILKPNVSPHGQIP